MLLGDWSRIFKTQFKLKGKMLFNILIFLIFYQFVIDLLFPLKRRTALDMKHLWKLRRRSNRYVHREMPRGWIGITFHSVNWARPWAEDGKNSMSEIVSQNSVHGLGPVTLSFFLAKICPPPFLLGVSEFWKKNVDYLVVCVMNNTGKEYVQTKWSVEKRRGKKTTDVPTETQTDYFTRIGATSSSNTINSQTEFRRVLC